MVRNAASMQSIRDSMANVNVNVSSPPPPNMQTTQQRAPSSSPETMLATGQGPVAQPHGMSSPYGSSDQYTTRLVNRIATGEATPKERANWEQHVANFLDKPLPSVHNNAFPQAPPQPTPPYPQPAGFSPLGPVPGIPPMQGPAGVDYQMQLMSLEQQNKKPSPTPGQVAASYGNHALLDYERQLNLLEQHNKKRAIANARANVSSEHSHINAFPQSPAYPSPPAGFMPPDPLPGLPSREEQALQDYQMQLKLLEPQNKKRLLMARQEQDNVTEHVKGDTQMQSQASMSPPLYNQPSNGNHALQDYQMQFMLLEQHNKRRALMARQGQDDVTDITKGDTQMQPQAGMLPLHAQPSGGNHALQDFQMQLKSLEQQNKKRLYVCRQQPNGTAVCRQEEYDPNGIANEITQMQPPARISPRYTFTCGGDSEREDYEMQLKSLEQQSKHRGCYRSEDSGEKPVADNEVLDTFDFDSFLNGVEGPSTGSDGMAKEQFGAKRRKHRAATDAVPEAPRFKQATRKNAAPYTEPFLKFLTDNPTVFHAVDAIKKDLKDAGFTSLSERDAWDIKPSGSYFVERNGSSLIAFTVGADYKPGNGAAILAGHVDALTAKLKPISQVPNKAGYLQLGIAPYAGAPNTTWWDRDLSVGGRVLVKEGDKIVTKLVKLDWPIARIPTLAPHFGAPASGPFNQETQMVPIIGLEGTSTHASVFQNAEPFSQPPLLGGVNGPVGSFVNTQPPALVKAIGKALGLSTSTYANMVNWELELFDVQPATVGGLGKEFIYAGRIDDKLCSWAAVQALIEAQSDTDNSSIIKVVGLFDDEEIGSLLRQGARGNFLPATIERAVGSLADHHPTSDLMGRTYANSFLVSSDVTHAVNPNFLGAYLENHAPHLNVGVVVSADSNGHMTTDSVSTALFKRCADKVGAQLQVFQIRNDSRSGGTVGPMLSSMTGIRAIDAGIPQLSMHSIRATTGALDPGLGVLMFVGFLNGFEEVDKEFK